MSFHRSFLCIPFVASLLAVSASPWYSSLTLATVATHRRATEKPATDVIRAVRDASGWPRLNGPTGDGRSTETGLRLTWSDTGPPERWRVAVGEGYSSPVVEGDDVILFHRIEQDELIDCLAADSGRHRWRFRDPTRYRCPVAYSSGPYSTPVISGPRIYALGAEGELFCLDRRNGSLLWKRSLSADYPSPAGNFPPSASPLLEGDRMILNLGGRTARAGIVAFDCATGGSVWTATDHGASCATAVAASIHDQRYVFVWTDQGLVALDPASGRVFWTVDFHANNPEAVHATSPLVVGDVVFVSGYQIGCLAVRLLPQGRYQELWRDKRRNLDSQYNNLIAADGHVYGYSSYTGALHCIDLLSGALRWKWRSAIRRGNAIALGDRLLLLGDRGHLGCVAISPERCRPVGVTASPLLEAPCYSAPAISNGLLYLRNQHFLICLDLRP